MSCRSAIGAVVRRFRFPRRGHQPGGEVRTRSGAPQLAQHRVAVGRATVEAPSLLAIRPRHQPRQSRGLLKLNVETLGGLVQPVTLTR